VASEVLWTACAVAVPAVLIYVVVHLSVKSPGLRLAAGLILLALTGALLIGADRREAASG
jgi:hypothetical protein